MKTLFSLVNGVRRPRDGAPIVGIAVLVLAGSLTGCGGDEMQYEPKPAVSGRTANMPPVPTLPQKPKKDGDAYTVWGATHDLRSKVHHKDINGKELSLVGYIVKTNYDQAPECAVHKIGKADPPDCKAPIPSFSIADAKGEQKDMIEVMGFASNFAQLYSTIEEVDKAPKGKAHEVEVVDPYFAKNIPVPIPAVGAKVKVTGRYGVTFQPPSGGAAANPKYGIMSAQTIEYLEPPTELANLPTMKPRKKSVEEVMEKSK